MIISDKKIIVFILIIFVLIFGTNIYFYKDRVLSLKYFLNFDNKYTGPNSSTDIINDQENIGDELAKTEFENQVPEGFLTAIPIEKGAAIEQSYTLDYPEQKQRTIVFESKKTVLDNQKIYADYLMDDQWSVSDNFVEEKIVSFYARKDNVELNIVIIFDDGAQKTKISISVLEHIK